MMSEKTDAQLLKEMQEAEEALRSRREELNKRQEAKRDKLAKNLDKIKTIVASCGVKGRIVIDVPENGDISVSVGEIKTRKARKTSNGNGHAKNEMTLWIESVLDSFKDNPSEKDVRPALVKSDKDKAGLVTDGQIKGTLRNWRIAKGYPTTK